MDIDARHSIVRGFCEENLTTWYKTKGSLSGFYQDCRFASLELLSISNLGGFDCVEIERIHVDVPKSISAAFERHFWYSQYSLSDLYFLKIPIAEKVVFIILIHGLLDDGWDNSGRWLEIFDEQGEFLDAGWFNDETIKWKERQLKGDDFYSPSPPWIGDEPGQEILKPVWSEEQLSQYAVKVEHNGAKIRYIMVGEND
jgi:hypothetical protein